jgi:hypothetical protein
MNSSQIELEGAALATLLTAIKPTLRPYAIPTDSRGHTMEGVLLVDFPPDGGDTRLVLDRDQLIWEKKGDVRQAGSWEIKDFQELTTEGAVMRFDFVQIVQNLASQSGA